MATQSLAQEMLIYFEQLTNAEQKSVLQLIKTFLKSRTEESDTVTIEQYNEEIDEAMKRIDDGHFTTQEELEKEAEKW